MFWKDWKSCQREVRRGGGGSQGSTLLLIQLCLVDTTADYDNVFRGSSDPVFTEAVPPKKPADDYVTITRRSSWSP